ncbi:MAG: hypothetical protein WHT47_03490 [Hydrogenothermaceae bacterium]
MQQSQQRNLPETADKVGLKSFSVNEKTGELIQKESIETPLILVESIPDFEENCFWINLKNLWILVGKVPPLTVEMDDIILFREKGKWGLFRFIEKKESVVILTDGMRKKKTKVNIEDFSKINLLGKVIRVQQKL